MWTAILSLLSGAASKLLTNPTVLLIVAGICVLCGIYVKGCSDGQSRQVKADESTIAGLKSRITQIENAPVKEHIEHTVTPAKLISTKTLTVIGTTSELTLKWKQRVDSLEAVLGDTVSKLRDKIEFLAMPYDSLTGRDTLTVDSLFKMPYRLYLAAQSPLDRLLAGKLLADPFDVQRDKLIREITLPPEPRPWYEPVLVVAGAGSLVYLAYLLIHWLL